MGNKWPGRHVQNSSIARIGFDPPPPFLLRDSSIVFGTFLTFGTLCWGDFVFENKFIKKSDRSNDSLPLFSDNARILDVYCVFTKYGDPSPLSVLQL